MLVSVLTRCGTYQFFLVYTSIKVHFIGASSTAFTLVMLSMSDGCALSSHTRVHGQILPAQHVYNLRDSGGKPGGALLFDNMVSANVAPRTGRAGDVHASLTKRDVV